jgi:plastocyanin
MRLRRDAVSLSLRWFGWRARYAGLLYFVIACVSAAALNTSRPPAPSPSRPAASATPAVFETATEPLISEPVAAIPSPTAETGQEPSPIIPSYRSVRPRPSQRAAPATPGSVSLAVVNITDRGISPSFVSLVSGGTVTWVNNGTTVHTATHDPKTAYALDSGGLAAGQSFSSQLFDPGTYRYTSAPDCLGKVQRTSFDCSAATIVVTSPTTAPSINPQALTRQQMAQFPIEATVHITDRDFVPAHLTIRAGSSVIWVNEGSKVHTATAVGPVRPFDSGGLGGHQSAKVTLSSPGTFAYSSAPDCLNGNASSAFKCTDSFSVTVLADR